MQEQKEKKDSWFRKFKTSIKDFDQYEDFATASAWENLKYFLILIIIFAIVIYALFIYKFYISDEQGIQFFKRNILNLDYDVEQMQILDVDNIIIQNKSNVIIPVWIFTLYLTTYLVDALIVAVLGYFVALIYRMKIRYKAVFNMALHCLTFPILLNLIYIVINSLTGFEIKYFQWMYTTISYIYMVVAILMIKTDLISRQMELIKIEQEQLKVREELKEKQEEEENKEEKKQEEPNKEEENKDNNIDDELDARNNLKKETSYEK